MSTYVIFLIVSFRFLSHEEKVVVRGTKKQQIEFGVLRWFTMTTGKVQITLPTVHR